MLARLLVFTLSWFLTIVKADCPSTKKAFFDQLDTSECWINETKDGGSANVISSSVGASGGAIKFKVDAYSKNRAKLCRTQQSILGTYEWRAYIPTFQPRDITSVGGFLYFDDYHEVDFECGRGKSDLRSKLGIGNQPSKMVCFLTTQAIDGKSWDTLSSDPFAIDGETWNTFTMVVTETDGVITVTWFVNGEWKKSVEHKWGSKDIPGGFKVYMSLENLLFMGDNTYSTFPATGGHVNEAVFDYFSYTPYNNE